MKYTPRDYQKKAIDKTLAWLSSAHTGDAGLIIAPTGSGKAILIAEIVHKSKLKTIIYSPSIEILEQNAEKLDSYGIEYGIFSASAGSKEFKDITLATVGSVVKRIEDLAQFELSIIDEAHLVGAKDNIDGNASMYKQVISQSNTKVVGLTATAYRTSSNMLGTMCKILTRTRSRIFKDIIAVIQVQEMVERGYLCPLTFVEGCGYNIKELEINTTGANYKEKSVKEYNASVNIIGQTAKATIENINERGNCLTFVQFIEEAKQVTEELKSKGIKAEYVTGKTKKADRKKIVEEFKAGEIQAVVNVTAMGVGFDYPGLMSIVIARPIMSIALYCQIVGRGTRIMDGKKDCLIKDLCGTYAKYGNPLDYKYVMCHGDKWRIRLRNNKNYLTGVYLCDMFDFEENMYLKSKGLLRIPEPVEEMLTFGRYKYKPICQLDAWYLLYGVNTFSGKWRDLCKQEYDRRRLGGLY